MEAIDFLTYSAAEPMTILRRKFNSGESLKKATPLSIPASEALVDIAYLRFVIENAYSGYAYNSKALFDNAFIAIESKIKNSTGYIAVNNFIDLIADKLSFICDGHLSLTTQTYGRGFYKKLQTYVADILIKKENNNYICVETGKIVEFSDDISAFPTIPNGRQAQFILGIRSKDPIDEIAVTVDSIKKTIPVHKIASTAAGKEIPIEEQYIGDTAIISCSSFVGNTDDCADSFFKIGKKCRAYNHVIWDLSNNLGGNSALAEHFLKGLNGGCVDSSKILELRSALVYAKECGEISDIPYHFTCKNSAPEQYDNLYTGTLHVIMNDSVASSAESAVIMAKSLPNVILYGCNSMGIGRFGDLCIYYLPHSQITVWCPQKVFDNTIEETVGCAPDIWIDSSDTIGVVFKHISHK